MLRTLRSRLIASHVGLLLLVLPLVGLALIYVLETQVLLVNLARQLTGQAVLVAELVRGEPAALQDPATAAAFVEHIGPLFPGQLMLLAADGTMLASSDPADAPTVGQVLTLPGVAEALAGDNFSLVRYSRDARAEVADVLVPVTGPDQQVLGIVRLTDLLGSVADRFQRLRTLIAGVLAGGLVVGTLVGLFLALTIERPLRNLTAAVDALTAGQSLVELPAEGPAETRTLALAFGRLVQRLHDLEQARHRLLVNLVHEIGRPLAALRAATRALLDGAVYESPLREELLAGMRAEMDRMSRLLDDLADLDSRVLGTLDLMRRPIAPGHWLPELLGPWRQAALDAGLEWQAGIPPGLPTVSIDPDRLGQALGNLLTNAIKFTPAGGTVEVMAGADGQSWWVTIRDTGIGIAPEEQVHVFEPFYRTAAERRYPYGLGLGLTIAHDIVVAHGGTIAVASHPGAGTTFTVRLPLAPAIPI